MQQYPFQEGIYGVLCGEWTLTLVNPLTIHNGIKAAYKQQDPSMKKGRGVHKDVRWKIADTMLTLVKKEKEGWSEVSDLNYAFRVQDGQITAEYAIPASSIRGTLRNTAIKEFVEREDRQLFQVTTAPSPEQKEEYARYRARILKALQHLDDKGSGWYDILSLFGCVFDSVDREEELQSHEPQVWAGRLRVSVDPLSTNDGTIDGVRYADGGPDNIKRHITVRNPLDRVTAEAKKGGLHFRMEMSPGESFLIRFHITNPRSTDIELLDAWRDNIKNGRLRFGALTNQGRGRTRIEKESYHLYWQAHCNVAEQLQELPEDNIFSQIWKGGELKFNQLLSLELP